MTPLALADEPPRMDYLLLRRPGAGTAACPPAPSFAPHWSCPHARPRSGPMWTGWACAGRIWAGGYWRVAAALPEPIRAAIRRRLDG